MTGNGPWVAQDNVEPIQADTIGAIANIGSYATISGCGQTYSISDMIVTIASGSVLHNSTVTAVAGNTVTLVSDPTNPRWTYQYVNSSGVAAIVSGTAAATPGVPDFGANVTGSLTYVQAGLTIAGNATYKLDKRVLYPGTSTVTLGGLVQNYKSSTQVLSATTTFADVTGAGAATFAVSIGASEVWEIEYWIPLAFSSTGGAKFQVTGPSSPTNVDITGWAAMGKTTDGTSPLAVTVMYPFAAVTAFSSAINAANAAANSTTATNGLYSSTDGSIVYIKARIRNGANAGSVVLQAAQNSAAGTTTLGLSTSMYATRIA